MILQTHTCLKASYCQLCLLNRLWYDCCFPYYRYQDSGRAMGYAHVDFTTAEAAAAAVALDGKYLMGRFLNVEYAKAKKSQKGMASCLK